MSATSLWWAFCSKNRPPLPRGGTARGGRGLWWKAHSGAWQKGDVAVEAVPAPQQGLTEATLSPGKHTHAGAEDSVREQPPRLSRRHAQAQPPPPAGDLLPEAVRQRHPWRPDSRPQGARLPPSDHAEASSSRASQTRRGACGPSGPSQSPQPPWEGSRSPRGLQWLPLHPLEQNPML